MKVERSQFTDEQIIEAIGDGELTSQALVDKLGGTNMIDIGHLKTQVRRLVQDNALMFMGPKRNLVKAVKYKDEFPQLEGAEWEEAMDAKGHNVNSHLREEGQCLQCGVPEVE
jgi:hypothetical protein